MDDESRAFLEAIRPYHRRRQGGGPKMETKAQMQRAVYRLNKKLAPRWKKALKHKIGKYMQVQPGRKTPDGEDSYGNYIYPQSIALTESELETMKGLMGYDAKHDFDQDIWGDMQDQVRGGFGAESDEKIFEIIGFRAPGLKNRYADYLPERFRMEEGLPPEEDETFWEEAGDAIVKVGTGIAEGFATGGPIGALVGGVAAAGEALVEEVMGD